MAQIVAHDCTDRTKSRPLKIALWRRIWLRPFEERGEEAQELAQQLPKGCCFRKGRFAKIAEQH